MKDDLFSYAYPYRYSDTMEPAIILLTDAAYRNDQIIQVAVTHSSLARQLPVGFRNKTFGTSTMFLDIITDEEVDMWRAFNLCPVVKVWLIDDRFFTEHVAP